MEGAQARKDYSSKSLASKKHATTGRGSCFSKDVFSAFLKQILAKCILNATHTKTAFRSESYFYPLL